MENIKSIKQQKENIMIYGDHISFDKAGQIYKKLQKRYPNCNVHFYTNGMFYNDSNCDELEFAYDETLYHYFVELRLINKDLSGEKREKYLFTQKRVELEPQEDDLEKIKFILSHSTKLDDALYCLEQYCLFQFQKGLFVPALEELLMIIKYHFPLKQIVEEKINANKSRKK